MPVSVQCQQCEAKYVIDDKFAGKRARCKKCGAVMDIPAPMEEGLAELLDDTHSTGGNAGIDPGPWGAPATSNSPPPLGQHDGGITSSPGRAWRPQDVVVEREGDVQEFALNSPFPVNYQAKQKRQPGATLDWLAFALIAGFVAALVANSLIAVGYMKTAIPADAWDAGLSGKATAYSWGYAGFVLTGLFVICGPVTLGCVAVGAKIRNASLPGSAYLRACGVAAVPAIVVVLVSISRMNGMFDESIGLLLRLASIPVAFLALRFIFGFDWATAAVCFGMALVFGGIAVYGTDAGSVKASESVFLKKEDVTRIAQKAAAARTSQRGAVSSPNSSPTVSNVQPTPEPRATVVAPTPEPTPVEPIPAPVTGDAKQITTTNLRQLGVVLNREYASNGFEWPRDIAAVLATGQIESTVFKSPFGPAAGGQDYVYSPGPPKSAGSADVVLAYDRAEYEKQGRATVLFADLSIKSLDKAAVDAALAKSKLAVAGASSVASRPPVAPRDPAAIVPKPDVPAVNPPEVDAGNSEAAVAFEARVRAAAGDLVSNVTVVPVAGDVVSVVRPAVLSTAFAVVSSNGQEDTVEVWSGTPPKKVGQSTFKVEPAVKSSYAVSADGQRVLRVAAFPKLSVKSVSSTDGRELASVDLNEALGQPTVIGFLSNDRALIRWEKTRQYGAEVVDFRTKKVVRQVNLPDHDPAPGNEAISPDGRYFATTSRATVRGEAVSQLALHSLFDGGTTRKLPIDALDARGTIQPAGIAFSSDGSKVAALFAEAGNALVVAWSVKGGKPLAKDGIVVPGGVEALKPLAGADRFGMRGGAGRSLSWLAGGTAWLVGASKVIGADDGRIIGDLGAGTAAFDQAAAAEDVVFLPFTDGSAKGVAAGVAVIQLDAKKLPALPAAAGATTQPKTGSVTPKR